MDVYVKNSLGERLLQLSKLILNTPLNATDTFRLDFFKLLDAFLVLYDECGRSDGKVELLSSFVKSYSDLVLELRALQVQISDFKKIVDIGSGRFGTVSVVKELGSDRYYALKVMRKDDVLQQLDFACFREERDIMAQSSSPWLTSLHYAFQDSHNLYLVMDFHPGGCLSNVIEHFNGRLKEEMVRFYITELYLALTCLHNMGYVHRDVKPDNILIDSSGHLKLADFGSASRLNAEGHVMNCVCVGTSEYIAPEVLNAVEDIGNSCQENCYGIECDYWSYGIVTFELVIGYTPFIGDSDMQTHRNILCHRQSFSFPKDIELSDEIMDLITKLITDATCRISGDELHEHVFFNGIDWENQINSHPPYIPTVDSPMDTSNFDKTKENKLLSFVNSSSKPQHYSDVPFVGFTFSRAAQGATMGNLCDFLLDCKTMELQDRIHTLDSSSRAKEKWQIKCMLDKRELVRRLKHAQEMCAATEQVTTTFVRNAQAVWEKQGQYEKAQMAAKIEQLEQELQEKCKDSCNPELDIKPDDKDLQEDSENSLIKHDIPGEILHQIEELDVVKAELVKRNIEKEAKESELFQLKEMIEKLKSSLNLEKDKTECTRQELEVYRNHRLVFTTDEFNRLVNGLVKLHQEVENVFSDQESVDRSVVEHCYENISSTEEVVGAVSNTVARVSLLRKLLTNKRKNTVDVEVNTECCVTLHKEVQTESVKITNPLLLKMQSQYQCLEQEHAKDLAELRKMSAHFEAEIKYLLDDSRKHAKAIEGIRDADRSESRQLAIMYSDREQLCSELDVLREQLRIETARASRCTEELESFKKMFLEKNAEAHTLKKQLEWLEGGLRDELGQTSCGSDSLIASLGEVLRQLRQDKADLLAANEALEKASVDLEDQVDQYHSMLVQLQSQMVLLQNGLASRGS